MPPGIRSRKLRGAEGGGTVTGEGKRQREGRRRAPSSDWFSHSERAIVPYPKTGHLDTGQLRADHNRVVSRKAGLHGGENRADTHRPTTRTQARMHAAKGRHAVEQIAGAGNAESRRGFPKSWSATCRTDETSPATLSRRGSAPCLFPCFENTHARGSTKYPCDPTPRSRALLTAGRVQVSICDPTAPTGTSFLLSLARHSCLFWFGFAS